METPYQEIELKPTRIISKEPPVGLKPTRLLKKEEKQNLGGKLLGGLKEAGEIALGLGEAGVSTISGLASYPINVATTLGALALGKDFEKAREIGGKVGEALTHEPLTEKGKTFTEVAMSPFSALSYGVEKGIETVAPGEPQTQAALLTAFDVALLKGIPYLKGKAKDFATKRLKEQPETVAKLVEKSEAPPEIKQEIKQAKIEIAEDTRIKIKQPKPTRVITKEPAYPTVGQEAPKPVGTTAKIPKQVAPKAEPTGYKVGDVFTRGERTYRVSRITKDELGNMYKFETADGREGPFLREKEFADMDFKPAGYEGGPEAGGVAYGMALPGEYAGVRIDKLNAPYDVKKQLLELTEKFKSKLKKKTVPWTETEKKADALKMTIDEIIKTPEGKAHNAAELEAMREQLGGYMVRLKGIQEQFRLDPNSIELQAKVAGEIDRGGMLLQTYQKGTSEAGRALNILRKPYEPGGVNFDQYKRVLKAIAGREGNQELVRRFGLLDMDNPLEVAKFLKDVTQVKFKDKIFEVWVNALLSSPVTHAVNITSNTITLFGKPVETAIAAVLEAPQRLIGRKPEVYFKQVLPEIAAIFQGVPEGVRKALHAWKNELTMQEMSKIETARPAAIKGKVGKKVRIPSRALMAMDELFKTVLYHSDITSHAYKIALKEGLKGDKLNARIAELIQNPTDVMMDRATGEALYRTFQSELGTVGKELQRLRGRFTPIQYIVPFMRTPINIAKFGLERTPMNLIRIAYKAARGKIPYTEFTREASKSVLGTATSIAIMKYVLEDKVTGAPPDDPRERATFYRQGKTPYSIKIGDKWYSYGRLEPFGTVLGIAADATQIWRDIERGDREKIAGRIILSVTQNLTNKTFLRGLSESMNAISDPERYGKQWVLNFSGTAIPTGVAQVARAVDPYIRETQGLVDHLKSRTPFLSKQLPAKRDIYGKPLERRGSAINRLISPVAVSTETKDLVDAELQRLDYHPGMPSRKVGEAELTSREYEQLSQAVGDPIHTELYKIITMPAYSRLPDEQRIKLISGRIRKLRELIRTPYRQKYQK